MRPAMPGQPQQQGSSIWSGIKLAGSLSGYSFLSQFGGGYAKLPILGLGTSGFTTQSAKWTGVMGLRTLAMGRGAARHSETVARMMGAFGEKGLLGKVAPGLSQVLGGTKGAIFGIAGVHDILGKGMGLSAAMAGTPLKMSEAVLKGRNLFTGGILPGTIKKKMLDIATKGGAKTLSEGALRSIKYASWSATATKVATGINVASNAYMVAKLGAWVTKSLVNSIGGAATNTIRALNQFNRIDFNIGAPDVGTVAPYMSGMAATERQRAAQFIAQSHGIMQQMGSRASVFGNEAELMHWGG